MPLGYTLKTGDVLAYYGLERQDVAEAIFKYGRDRKVTITTDPGVLGGGGGQAGFKSSEEILALARKVLDGDERTVPRKYPGFHGTIGRYGGLFGKAQSGADMVIDIDVKNDYREAFRNGRRVMDFLDFYNVPYRVKFSGGSGPHIIIPYEAFPESLLGRSFGRAFHHIFQIIQSRSRASHIDGSFTSANHFYRMPYSLNEHTGLVSLPIRREQYNDFHPSMAEIWSVEIDEEWFREPDEQSKMALAELLMDAEGKRR